MIRYLIHRPTTDGKYYAVIAGLSTDAKPTASLITGSRFVAADTGARYMFDESAGQWNETDFQDQIDAAVQAWLDDHPEATTTVQDGSITKAKLHDDLADEIEQNTADVGALKSALYQNNVLGTISVGNEHVEFTEETQPTPYNPKVYYVDFENALTKGDTYAVSVDITEAHWHSSGNYFMGIYAQKAKASAPAYIIDTLQDITTPITGNFTLSYTPTDDGIVCLRLFIYYGAGTTDFDVYVTQLGSPVYDKASEALAKANDLIALVGNYSTEDIVKHLITDAVVPVFPATLYICGGQEMNIYYKNMIRYFNTDAIHRIVPASSYSGAFPEGTYRAKYTPPNNEERDFRMRIYYYLYNTYQRNLISDWCDVKVVPRDSGAGLTKTVLFIGDSITDNGNFNRLCMRIYDLFQADLTADSGAMKINFIGTRDTDTNAPNEGYGGWRFYTFVHCANGSDDPPCNNYVANPFYNPSTHVFDFSYYMAQNNFSGVDYVFINLGTNDQRHDEYSSDENIIANANIMINSIKTYNPDVRIGLWLPPLRGQATNANRAYIDSAMHIPLLYMANFSGMELSDNLYLIPAYLNVDPDHDYVITMVDVSADNSQYQETYIADTVHPSEAGSKKLGDVEYSYIKYFGYLDAQ